MLTKKDLETKQITFREYSNGEGKWFDKYFDYQISIYKGFYALFLHDESDGSVDLLCEKIENIQHLKSLYESLSDETFE